MPAVVRYTDLPAAAPLAPADGFLVVQDPPGADPLGPRRASIAQVVAAARSSMGAKGATITAPAADERIILFPAPEALTVTSLRAVAAGGSAVSFRVAYAGDPTAPGTGLTSAALTCMSGSAGLLVTSFAAPLIPAGAWVWLDLTVVSGAVNAFHVTLSF